MNFDSNAESLAREGWCSACGCGNDRLSFAHLEGCLFNPVKNTLTPWANVEDQAFRMMQFAMKRHAPQKRKYTGDPYFLHLAEVAGIVATLPDFGTPPGAMPTPPLPIILAVAWGHDLMEDQGVTREELLAEFHPLVSVGIEWLSEEPVSEGRNRAVRKAAARETLAGAPGWLQSIKYGDILSNTASIMTHDPHFGRPYVHEKRATLDVMTNGNAALRALAYSRIATILEA